MNVFIFNKCLRPNSLGLKECVENGPTIGVYIKGEKDLNPLVKSALPRLKVKLNALNIPLYLVEDIKDIYKLLKNLYFISMKPLKLISLNNTMIILYL